jgi:hypothetical protein
MAVDARAASEGVELGFRVAAARQQEAPAPRTHAPMGGNAPVAIDDEEAFPALRVSRSSILFYCKSNAWDASSERLAAEDAAAQKVKKEEQAKKKKKKKKQAAVKKKQVAKKEAVTISLISSESEDEPSRCDKARERSAAQDQAPADAAQEVAALAAEAPTAVDFADSSSEEDAQLSMLDAMAAKASVAIAEVEMALARVEVRAPADASAPDAAPDVALNALGRQDQDQEGFMAILEALDNEYGEAPLRERARYKSAGAWRAIVDASRCLGKKVVNVLGDGNCLFRAICRVKDGTEDGHAVLREVHGREKRPGKEGDDDDLQEISTALRRTILVLVGDSATGLYREFRPEVAVSMEEERMPIVVAFHRNHYYGVVDAGGENEEI